jgi:hypothetical protein
MKKRFDDYFALSLKNFSRRWGFLSLFFFLSILSSFALGPFFLQPFVSGSMGKAELDHESDSPEMHLWEVGGTVGLNLIPFFYFGFSSEFQRIDQASPTNNTFGDRKGKRVAGFAPTIGFIIEDFVPIHLQYQYQMMGDYHLSNPNFTGRKVSYSDVSGHRLTAEMGFPIIPFMFAGFFYETLKFEKLLVGNVTSSIAGANAMKLNHYGIIISAHF